MSKPNFQIPYRKADSPVQKLAVLQGEQRSLCSYLSMLPHFLGENRWCLFTQIRKSVVSLIKQHPAFKVFPCQLAWA